MEIVSIFFFYNKKKLFHNRGLYRANRIVERTDKETSKFYKKGLRRSLILSHRRANL